jgi:methylated-DNA-[protein]-cysteine S-methyltransferase
MWKTELSSPVGILHAFADEKGLTGLVWPLSDDSRFDYEFELVRPNQKPIFNQLKTQLGEYFDRKRKSFDLPLNPSGTEFQVAAWNALCEIPYGTTRTYAEQAAIIGRPKAVRAVGAANGKNPISIVIPCHRVIGSNGKLTGFAGGVDVKRFLLEHESEQKMIFD